MIRSDRYEGGRTSERSGKTTVGVEGELHSAQDVAENADAIRTSGLFDETWYLERYPEVKILGVDPIEHYLFLGKRLGRNPSPSFDGKKYLQAHPDVAASGIDPFVHYVRWGKNEGRSLDTPFVAPIKHGKKEGSGKLADYSQHLRDIFDRAKPTTVGVDLEYVPKLSEKIDFANAPLDVVAYYLPQFHPIPENNEWWGVGFTEWTNVSKATPQFLGHYQPHLPGELGFYDLRLVDIMRQQAELARLYGVTGFCFHHYWFGGHRLLERPVNQFLAAKDIDIKFCLCWANENWTRRWDGAESELLMAQNHSPEDDIAFIDDIIPVFRDPRYIKFKGRPVLLVYRVTLLPDAKATAKRWRKRCKEAGVGDPYLVAARSFGITNPAPFGFDASVEFPPHEVPASRINDLLTIINDQYEGNVYSYEDIATGFAAKKQTDYPLLKAVMPSWDNEARRPGKGHVFYGSSPANYARWLRQVYAWSVERQSVDQNRAPLLFVNAWNEWAEGAHLEPDRKYGYAYLHATANVIRSFVKPYPEVARMVANSQEGFAKQSNIAVILHLHYDDLLDEIAAYVRNVPDPDIFISIRRDIGPQTCANIMKLFPAARLTILPNRGRDVQPFLEANRFVRFEGYDLVCKVHAKKSPQRTDGKILRQKAFSDLLGSSDLVSSIVSRFRDNPKLGMIVPGGSLLPLEETDRNILNRSWLDKLLPKVGLEQLIGTYSCNFVAGSMFWFRPPALSPLDHLAVRADDFEEEAGQVDGTLAHAIERLFVAVAEKSGYSVWSVERKETEERH